jgi:methylated-DNA-[protein]-cysteine S-methyltransferase
VELATLVESLRARGLRSTPQRRAILAVFDGGRPEHLSADEVHARASQTLPDLGRGTVYATLAEFTELGLLSAFGASEPVRYETNIAAHDHFRCRLCLRLFDIDGAPDVRRSLPAGFVVERVETRLEGTCGECAEYESALGEGAEAILLDEPLPGLLELDGVAAARMDSPLGELLLAATPSGLIRLAFEEHADAERLRGLATGRRGALASRRHLEAAIAEIGSYFAGETAQIECTVDWDALAAHSPEILRAAREIPYATTRSYVALAPRRAAREVARPFGENPVPLLVPCHRVTRGVEVPEIFVGGASRRTWLLGFERAGSTA